VKRYTGPIVDVDVHHRAKSDAEIYSYLPKQWQEFVKGNGREYVSLSPAGPSTFALAPGDGRRMDAWGDEGFYPGSDYEMLRKQLLDPYNYFRAILTHDVGSFATHLNQYYARAVCQAVNDWNIDNWLQKDKRLYSVVVAPMAEPEEAAREIRRVGKHPQMVSVLFSGNPLGRPMGDPLFHPMYEAAADMGLAISVHIGNDRPNGQMRSAGGTKGYIEELSQWSQQAMHYISSLIVHGVFEKYPNLHVVFKEYGVAWLPSLMLRLDDHTDLLRRESPWVKRWPSEYIQKHIKVSTQPIEESPDGRSRLIDLLQTVDGMDDVLCFSTDYPHWSMDEPEYVARLLPTPWLRKVFCDNACVAFNWRPPADGTVSAQLATAKI
jgi:uncharacterized protein